MLGTSVVPTLPELMGKLGLAKCATAEQAPLADVKDSPILGKIAVYRNSALFSRALLGSLLKKYFARRTR